MLVEIACDVVEFVTVDVFCAIPGVGIVEVIFKVAVPSVLIVEVGKEVPNATTVEVGSIVLWIVVVIAVDRGAVPDVATADVGSKVPELSVEIVDDGCEVRSADTADASFKVT